MQQVRKHLPRGLHLLELSTDKDILLKGMFTVDFDMLPSGQITEYQ